MIGLPMRHRTDDADFVGDFRRVLQVVAEMNAFELGFYCAKRAAVLNGRQQLGVKGLLCGDPSREEYVDNRLGLGFGGRGLGLQSEEIPKSQPDAPEQPHKEELPPVRLPHMIGLPQKQTLSDISLN